MSEILPPVIFQMGTGGIAGFFIGFAVKKLLKILAVIIGLFSLAVAYLGYKGVLHVDYQRFAEVLGGLIPSLENVSWLTPILSHIPFAGSMGAGALLGWKMG